MLNCLVEVFVISCPLHVGVEFYLAVLNPSTRQFNEYHRSTRLERDSLFKALGLFFPTSGLLFLTAASSSLSPGRGPSWL